MILLVERVREARVSSAGETLGVIGPGLKEKRSQKKNRKKNESSVKAQMNE
jgi:D-Tyr-tRNAtyr deacylase